MHLGIQVSAAINILAIVFRLKTSERSQWRAFIHLKIIRIHEMQQHTPWNQTEKKGKKKHNSRQTHLNKSNYWKRRKATENHNNRCILCLFISIGISLFSHFVFIFRLWKQKL